MKKLLSTALLVLLGSALPASAQVQASLNDLILGFRATGGQGQNTNLEVNLGSVALYTSPASSPMVVTRLSATDLAAVYGATWNTRTDLSWGIVGTAGRVGAGGPTGQPLATLWATRARTALDTQSIPFTPSSRNGQMNASSAIETLLLAAPGSLHGATATANSAYSAVINATLPGSYSVQDTLQPGTSFGFFNPSIGNSAQIAGGSYAVSDLYELRPGAGSATYVGSFGLASDGRLIFATSAGYFSGGGGTPPAVTTQPASQTGAAGGAVALSVAASGSPTIQWMLNGSNVAGGTSATLNLLNLQPASAGLYTATLTNSGGTISSNPAIVGVTSASKVIGTGTELTPTNIVHPNGNVFDQVLVTGTAETITADAGQVTRTSYIDLNDDIVQVEFSGAGSLTLVLSGSSGPAAPTKYNQPTVQYMKGHAGIVIVGANQTTNVSVFTVGRATAFDPTGGYNILLAPSGTNVPANNGSSLFTGQGGTSYDGVADLAFIAISSTNGKFGGIRTANATYWADTGVTGIYAPGVEFTGPVFAGDINAKGAATPYLTLGAAGVEVRITGGDLKQDNGRAVQIDGFTQLHFKDGSTSGGAILTAQSNKGQLVKNGVDVTATVALAPGQ